MSGPKPMLAGGQWVATGDSLDVSNPYTGETVAAVDLAGPEEADRAVAAAVEAFGRVRHRPSHEAAALLHRIVEGLRDRRAELAGLIVAEAGKPVTLAEAEVERSIVTFTLAAEEAGRIGGEVLPVDITPATADRMALTRRFPAGPVVGITPFNFPLNLVAHKVAPALASRNPIIVKPSPDAPLTALALGEIVMEAGATPGEISVLPAGVAVSQRLVADPRIATVSFTGSPAVGWQVRAAAPMKKVLLELGGNAAAVLCEDADLDWAIPRLAAGAFGYAGQVCISVQRILVHRSCYDETVARLVAATESLVTGDPAGRATLVGPMINPAALARTAAWVEEAVAGGATLLTGGVADGPCYRPTLLAGVEPSMKVCCEEVFAPVAVVSPFDEFDEAVAMVNDGRFGLQAGIFTNRMDRAFAFFERAEVGGVIVNDFPTFRVDNMPYGGVKQSGSGREGIRWAIAGMTEEKVMVLRRDWGPNRNRPVRI